MAVDFDTTYSRVAYAFSSKPRKVNYVEQWPGSSKTFSKTPTVLKYTSKNNSK
ncbi:hypothetical protein CC78DRAFT_574603 [Lojkania enalia]|uniref:Uncharacterized protein n=1 Tax=Lojkania enalia TaxID=147567 RepID=A0A9P4TNY5_9PLEO|nr:hypothetical protein CC78DRAFT_574603 [Didymosphaeria enalia]